MPTHHLATALSRIRSARSIAATFRRAQDFTRRCFYREVIAKPLAYWCIKWAKHRQREAAVKLHMVANVANMLPRFDETIRLTGTTTKADYPRTLRRVKALVEVKGEMREMVFCTNNFEWSASTVAGLYRARWAVELLFKELKQTLQLQSRNNLVNKTLLKHFLSLHSRYGIHSPHHNLPHCSPGFWP